MLAIMPNLINQTDVESLTIKPAEAARLTQLSTSYLARLADRGLLTVTKPGGTHRRYLRSEIEELARPTKPQTASR